MKDLRSLNLNELTMSEAMDIEGGGKGRLLRRIIEWIGVHDAISDFREGWNSVEAQC